MSSSQQQQQTNLRAKAPQKIGAPINQAGMNMPSMENSNTKPLPNKIMKKAPTKMKNTKLAPKGMPKMKAKPSKGGKPTMQQVQKSIKKTMGY